MPPRVKSSRAWQRMLSGRRLDLLDPTPFDIEIADIAHGLAFVARWNGQTQGDWPYSVAEHSLLVEVIFSHMVPQSSARSRLAALLHDAPEYVIGDMISPVKSALGLEYGEIDRRISAAIHRRFGLPAALPHSLHRQIKAADRISARIEAERIAGFTPTEAKKLFPVPQADILDYFAIMLRPPAQVRQAYLSRFDELMALADQEN
ncbi:MAG: HD family hydrolase [Paracoccus sp. (in: a-proteobacteria)]|uniref:HD family hydrolase n=1 Tax=Paracoccus sp. TaxID=267 RepID=UPI0026E08DA1|nr:HD family hydrolase [Paracoccus sp. (in: a-proteobacteria)]MDO5632547.1 HD family hydrolase [Paracoccus sp. (in: a-proteobacteria)]